MLKPTIFRRYDIRGIAESELLSDGITELRQTVGTFMQRHGGGNKINLAKGLPHQFAALAVSPSQCKHRRPM
jgi:phosphomannomutase